MDALTQLIIKKKLAGHQFEDIAASQGIAVEDVVKHWRSYVEGRMVMSEEEQWVLHFLRLENLLTKATLMLESSSEVRDIESVLAVLDRIEALQALNRARKTDAEALLVRITEAQSSIILKAFLALKQMLSAEIEQAFEKHKTIKAIRADVTDVIDNQLITVAQKALTETGEKEQ